MKLALQSFSTLVQNMAATVQSATNYVLDLSPGSVIRAMLEANASIALWMQWLILQVLQTTRASTSTGTDLDSWMADFTLTRLPAVAATGMVTFARKTPGLPAIVPLGALVRTADGTQSFAVAADPGNSAWLPGSSAYRLAAAAISMDLPVTAMVAGAAGNVQAGMISQLSTAIPGIDSVTNQVPLNGGLDAETDNAFRQRFRTFIQSRSLATPLAIINAITSVQQGLRYTLSENVNFSDVATPGSFVIVVDDGSGYPPPSLLSSVQSAVDAVRPIGTTFVVLPPTVLPASIQVSVVTDSGLVSTATTSAVVAAVSAFISSLGIGAPLAVTRIAQLAYSADSSVQNVTAVLINGSPADLQPAPSQVIVASTISVT